jgi:hypothetical protein
MSPIPEFTDALSESTKSCDTSVTKATEKNTETDRNPIESENDRHVEPLPQTLEDTSQSATDSLASRDVGLIHMAAENESSMSPGGPQNEKPSEISGSPVEEHWLEVSIPKYNFVCYQCNSTSCPHVIEGTCS